MSVVFNIPKFVYTLHARPVEFWTAHVRNVFSPSKVPEVKLLLAKCSQLVNVTWRWKQIDDKGALLLLPSAASLSSLSITRRGFMEIATLGVIFINLKYVDLSGEEVSEVRLPPLSWAPALLFLKMQLEPAPGYSRNMDKVPLVMEDILSLALDPPPLDTLTLDVPDDFQEAIELEVGAIDLPFHLHFAEEPWTYDYHFALSVRWLKRYWGPREFP
ncbi:hypothetical protein H0H93_009808 [Arthromyces matolae]|nr:hypothetical protein H0H93_009808 [Arthromyces matolae]